MPSVPIVGRGTPAHPAVSGLASFGRTWTVPLLSLLPCRSSPQPFYSHGKLTVFAPGFGTKEPNPGPHMRGVCSTTDTSTASVGCAFIFKIALRAWVVALAPDWARLATGVGSLLCQVLSSGAGISLSCFSPTRLGTGN